jgi:integrase
MKFTLMVRFYRLGKKHFDRKPAAYGKNGKVKPGWIEYRDRKTKELVRLAVDRCSYDIRVEDKGTSYLPVGRNATDAEAHRLLMMSKATGRLWAEKAGLEVRDPEAEASRRVLLADEFEEYIADAHTRNALEAKEQAQFVAKEFLAAFKVKFADEVNGAKILEFDESLRFTGRGKRTIANQRQRLQSMFRLAGVDPKGFPPKPKFEKKLPTMYNKSELSAMFAKANPYQRMVCSLALKLGLRDQEVQFAEFTDISWEESVFRVRSKPRFSFTVKVYEERDIPIPLGFRGELREWKDAHSGQNLIVPANKAVQTGNCSGW